MFVIHGQVYDVGKWMDEHPGGAEVLRQVAHTDATERFEGVGHSDMARSHMKGMVVGYMQEAANLEELQQSASQLAQSSHKFY